MYSAAFIYEPGQYDDEFHVLNAVIDEIALSVQGYLGQELWRSKNGSKISVTYFWESMESLQASATHPKHIEAKRQYRWYNGYHIVISEVIKSYGDSSFSHFTPNQRLGLSPLAVWTV